MSVLKLNGVDYSSIVKGDALEYTDEYLNPGTDGRSNLTGKASFHIVDYKIHITLNLMCLNKNQADLLKQFYIAMRANGRINTYTIFNPVLFVEETITAYCGNMTFSTDWIRKDFAMMESIPLSIIEI